MNTIIKYVIEKNQELLKNIYEELVANRMMNQRLWNMMNGLKDNINKLTEASVPLGFSNEVEHKLFMSKFPFSNKEDVLECEKDLQIDNNVREKLVCSSYGIIYFIL